MNHFQRSLKKNFQLLFILELFLFSVFLNTFYFNENIVFGQANYTLFNNNNTNSAFFYSSNNNSSNNDDILLNSSTNTTVLQADSKIFSNYSSDEVTTTNRSLTPYSSTYNAKFVCGSINGDEGPLRPGHYDTDISIYNKQINDQKIFWNVVVNNNNNQNSFLMIKNIKSESSINIVCSDIRKLIDLDVNKFKFIEGFVIIRTGNIYGLDTVGPTTSGSQIYTSNNQNTPSIDVQVFYTANALEKLPHEILVDSIVFRINNDTFSQLEKIPKSIIGKELKISLYSNLNQIVSLDEVVRSSLMENYNLNSNESKLLDIDILDSDLTVDSMIDDHAISLSRILPN